MPITLEKIQGTNEWLVSKPYQFKVTTESLHSETIPKGFKTDLASIPRIFWSVFPPSGIYTEAAVEHDYLYWCKCDQVSRKEADKHFYKRLRELGTGPIRSRLMYLAVRLFGGSRYGYDSEGSE